MKTLAPYAKAVAGGLVSGLTALGTALIDGFVSPLEWVTIALAFLLGTGLTYAVPNTPTPNPPKDPTPNRTETP